MKDDDIEFWAADGLNLLRIIQIDENQKSFYLRNQSGKITWPLEYEKLEEVHNKIHNGEITLLSYEIDKLIPTWETISVAYSNILAAIRSNFYSGLMEAFAATPLTTKQIISLLLPK